MPPPIPEPEQSPQRAERVALLGLAANALLGLGKLAAGILGHSYALIADAAESLVDVFGSLLVFAGLRYSRVPADKNHPYGHWRAESLAALAASQLILLLGVAVGIGAVRRLINPSPVPASWTLIVLVAVIALKETMFRVQTIEANRLDSPALRSEAWHHRSDAITSLAALVGVAIAVLGGPRYAFFDPLAGLLAAMIVLINGVRLARTPILDLMDTTAPQIAESAAEIAMRDGAVRAVEQAHARRLGRRYWIDMHIEVDASMTVDDAHRATGRLKEAIRLDIPSVTNVLIHVEPHQP
jgi:cation diffusion facilitator family transporter